MQRFRRFRFSKKSIFSKLLILIFAAILIQGALFGSVILFGGTLDRMEAYAFDVLNERVANRTRDLENEMIQRWSALEETVLSARSDISDSLDATAVTAAAFTENSTRSEKLLNDLSDDLIYVLRKNSVTGAFIIFEGGDQFQPPSDKDLLKSGLYFRDSDPSTVLDNHSDLLAERAPSTLVKSLDIPMDSYWQPYFNFTSEDYSAGHSDFYYKPLLAAISHPEISCSDLGYWSKPFILPGDMVPIITYSVPLTLEDGTVVGVLGVELSCDYIAQKLPYQELDSQSKSGYLLALIDRESITAASKSMIFANLVKSGPILNHLIGSQNETKTNVLASGTNTYPIINAKVTNDKVYACIHPLQLYNTNTPFENEQWVLIGMEGGHSLLAFSSSLYRLLLAALFISMLFGLIFSYFSSRSVTRPITTLVCNLKQSNPHDSLHLKPINISEIDELSRTIETLSQDVANSASKLSRIITMAGINISAFEYRTGDNKVLCTDQFFSMLEHPGNVPANGYLDLETFQSIYSELEGFLESVEQFDMTPDTTPHKENNVKVFRLTGQNGSPRWLRLKEVINDNQTLGVLTDITRETIEKKKIEHDRDYDLLTDLYNRRAFYQVMHFLFQHPEKLGVAVLIMLDLDNLKYINDTYGHDYGDKYIQSAAKQLQSFEDNRTVISRMAGDEFLIFLYGYHSREGASAQIERIYSALKNTPFQLPDQTETIIRASAGYAWYPDDADQYEELIRYADFAMYLVKRTTKGQFAEFDKDSYEKGSYLLHSKEELNTLIEKKKLSFAFQPILDARTGEIFGYEALMRPNTPNIRTPLELLMLARSQSKLHEIERLTFFESLERFRHLEISKTNCKLFVNSISNQSMDEQDIELFEQQYRPYLDRLVIELTEEERLSFDLSKAKQQVADHWNCGIALDDFGAGFNGETVLLNLHPDLVKLDMTLIRNIHVDENRRNLLDTLITYMHQRGIKIIAEGIECREELECLVREGVDYLQGFYLGMPDTNPPPCVSEQIRTEIIKMQP